MDFASVLAKTREHIENLLRVQPPPPSLEALREAAAEGRRALVASAQGFSHVNSPRPQLVPAMPPAAAAAPPIPPVMASAPGPAVAAAPVDPFASFGTLAAASVQQPQVSVAQAEAQFPSPVQPPAPRAASTSGAAAAAAADDPFAGL